MKILNTVRKIESSNRKSTQARVFLMVRSGKITQSNISISSDPRVNVDEADIFDSMLKGKAFHEIHSFETLLGPAFYPDKITEIKALSSWLHRILGNQ